MSPSVNIRRRQTAKGEPRFQVRYRLGGRGYKLIHAGSFTTLKEARQRRDLVAGELAAGREWRDFWIGVYREERLPQAEREGASRG